MNLIRLLHLIATTSAIAKANAEGDDGSVLSTSGSGLIVKKKLEIKEKEKETSIFQSVFRSPKRMLEAAASRLLQIDVTIDLDYFDCSCCDDEDDDENSPAPTSSMNPTTSPTYSPKKIGFPDYSHELGTSCSLTDDYVVIGLPESGCNYEGVAYLFKLDGTEVKKITAGVSPMGMVFVSMDEKVVVGGGGPWFINSVRVFSREGVYERTIEGFSGPCLVTLGNLIVGSASSKLLIYTTEGELLHEINHGKTIDDVAMSEQYIVLSSSWSNKTIVYSNEATDFPLITEIENGGKVEVAGDRLVISSPYSAFFVEGFDVSTWLYSTNGTLIKTLEFDGYFSDIAITDSKVLIGNQGDGRLSGSISMYSAVTGEFIKKVLAPDGPRAFEKFGASVCATNSHFVGITEPLLLDISIFFPFFFLRNPGNAYLIQLPS